MPVSRHRVQDYRENVSGIYQTFPPFPSTLVQTKQVGSYTVCDDQVCAPRETRLPQTLLIVKQMTELPRFSGRYPVSGSPIKQLSGCPADYAPAPPSPGTKFPALSTIDQSNLAWQSLAATNPNVAHVSLPTFWAELKDLPSLWQTWIGYRVRSAKKLWDEFIQSESHRGSIWYGEFLHKIGYRPKQGYVPIEDLLKYIRNNARLSDIKAFLDSFPKFHIWYRWGWAPLVSDIRKMFSFTEAVSNRFKWLLRLQSGDRVLRRRATLRHATAFDPPTTVALKSVGANIQGRRTVVYTEKVWTTVQWKLATDVRLPSNLYMDLDSNWKLAHDLTYGMTTQEALTALWEIMPWSWFVDWFLHVQTVMDATKNTIPLTWGPICVMRHTRATALVSPLTSSADLTWCKPSGNHRQYEDRKQRLIVSPVLPFAPSMMPVFTTGQWSILGSLALLRAVRG